MSMTALVVTAAATAAATMGPAAAMVRCANSRARKARTEAEHDGLTGLANRAGLLAELRRREFARQQYAVVLIDLDGFKAVNDTYGHAAGDAVLVEVGRRLSVLTTGFGLTARLGGDEFVVVADSASAEMSALLGRQVARAITASVLIDGSFVEVAGSVGAVHAFSGDSPRELLHSADVAMYRAKITGSGHSFIARLVGVDAQRPSVRLRELAAVGRAWTEA